MAKELIINASLPELRIALSDEGEIQELLIERKEEKGIVGNIYKGRVTRVLPGMQAAFVDIGLEKAAFLYVDDVYGHSDILDPKEIEEDEETFEAETESDSENESENESENDLEEDDDLTEEDVENENDDLLMEEAEREEEAESLELSSTQEQMEPIMDKSSLDEDASSLQERVLEPKENEVNENESETDAVPLDTTSADGQEKKVLEIKPVSKDRSKEDRQKSPFLPPAFHDEIHEEGESESDRSDLSFKEDAELNGQTAVAREQSQKQARQMPDHYMRKRFSGKRPEFRQKRDRSRRIHSKQLHRRHPAKIENLLKEGQDVIVQVAKDPIAQKGARLTCHVSLAGRHLVCMPTIDHVGVSRRIERFDERRKLREYVEKNKPKGMGFIIRTASGGKEPETWIKTDIDYLNTLWQDIAEKASQSEAPALVYEDVNSILRALRDWIDEDINKVIIDSRYHYNEIKSFCEKFMPALSSKIELYHGDIPLFDAYGISQELNRAMERKVWLKSGGYLVIDQAEALVAIDVNTGRFVGQKNLEDTILKTNLEAVREVAYQMRLRNSGGIIIIDLIDMEREENKAKVVRALEEELKKDRSRPSVVRISDLGLIELTRKRTRDTMVRILGETCPHCEGKGFIKSKSTVAYELMRNIEREGIHKDVKKILIQAHPDVIDILAIDERDAIDQLEKRYRKKIFLQAVNGFHQEQFEIIPEKNENAPDYREEFSRDRERGGSHSQRQRRPQHSHPQNNRNERFDRNKSNKAPFQKKNLTEGNEPRSTSKELPVDDDMQPSFLAQPAMEPGEERLKIEMSPKRTLLDPDAQPRFDSENAGNAAPPAFSRAPLTEEEEEDRLAFLRAQAAQDAAIASLGAQSDSSPSVQGKQSNGAGGRSNRNGAGAGTNRNNRNGKFGRHTNGGRNQRNANPPGGARNNRRPNGPQRTPQDRPERSFHRGGIIEPREPLVAVSTPPVNVSEDSGDSSSES